MDFTSNGLFEFVKKPEIYGVPTNLGVKMI